MVLAAEAAAGLMCCGVVLLAGDNACIALSSLRSIALRITEHVCVKHSCSGDSTCAGTALSSTKWSGGDARFGFGDIILFALRFVCFFFLCGVRTCLITYVFTMTAKHKIIASELAIIVKQTS